MFVATDTHPVHPAVDSVGAWLCSYSTNAYHCIKLTCAHLAHAVLDTKYALSGQSLLAGDRNTTGPVGSR